MTNDEKNALNRTLFRRCKAVFGNVRISQVGEKQIRKTSIDLITGKPKEVIIHAGEYYAVCCPFCNDTRFRCYINHCYGSDNQWGKPQLHLATCFNGGCPLALKTAHIYEELEQMLVGHHLVDLRKVQLREGRTVDVSKIRSSWPGEVTRVDKLPSTHEANVYLAGRGFDPDKIGRFYNVHWCHTSDRYICRNRLIIPIYHDKQMVGWQARAAFETDWKKSSLPKYYTAPGTPRRNILYNLGNASQYEVGIIVEGVTDVWRVGPQAVCTLGATLTNEQQTLFRQHFKDYSGVLLFDPDVKDKLESKVNGIEADLNARLKSGFCSVQLPEGTDPGSLDRTMLREYITKQASDKGVIISWKKR